MSGDYEYMPGASREISTRLVGSGFEEHSLPRVSMKLGLGSVLILGYVLLITIRI